MKHECKGGELGEGYAWEYHNPFTSTTSTYESGKTALPCKHAKWTGDEVAQTRNDGSIYGYERPYEVPEVAVCFNEAHHNRTELCLRCADEVRAVCTYEMPAPHVPKCKPDYPFHLCPICYPGL